MNKVEPLKYRTLLSLWYVSTCLHRRNSIVISHYQIVYIITYYCTQYKDISINRKTSINIRTQFHHMFDIIPLVSYITLTTLHVCFKLVPCCFWASNSKCNTCLWSYAKIIYLWESTTKLSAFIVSSRLVANYPLSKN